LFVRAKRSKFARPNAVLYKPEDCQSCSGFGEQATHKDINFVA